jgi:hypothetical protein
MILREGGDFQKVFGASSLLALTLGNRKSIKQIE